MRVAMGSRLMLTACLSASLVGCGWQRREPVAESPPALRFSHTIGCDECAGAQALSAQDISLLDSGFVIVLDEHPPFVRVFDASGNLLRSFAGRGEGPGELGWPGFLMMGEDGSLRVLDAGRMQFKGFDLEGDPLPAVRYPMGMGVTPIATTYDPNAKAIYVSGTRMGTTIPTVARLRLEGGDGEILWSGAELPGVEDAHQVHEEGHPSHFAVAVARSGAVAVGNGYHYRIAIYDADGTLQHQLGRELQRRAKPGELYEMERRRSMPRWEPTPDFPHFRSTSLQFDDDGLLWVRRVHGEEGQTTFDLFRAGTGYIGALKIDFELVDWRVPSFEVRGNRLAAIVYGPTENTLVMVWDLQRGVD